MKEQDSDRLIDAAARQMVAREPSRGLANVVMRSVRETEPPAPRRFVWATAAAAVVLCGAIAVAVMSRIAAPATQPPPPTRPLVAQPPTVAAVAPVNPPDLAAARPPAVKAVARRSAPLPQLPPADFSGIEPLETETIAISTIDVPPLEHEDVSIAGIDIEPLTIEPLAASND